MGLFFSTPNKISGRLFWRESLVVAILSVGGVCVTMAYQAGTASSVSADTHYRPVREPPTFNGTELGEIWESPANVIPLTVKNPTAVTIQVHSFSTSCSCTGTEPQSIELPPRGEVSVNVILDSTNRGQMEMGLARREFTSRIQPLAEGLKLPAIEFRGVVRSRVTLDGCSNDSWSFW